MEVILQKDVNRLGKAFEIVKVKDGFALNYLLPQKLAQLATPGSKKRIELDRKKFERKEGLRLKESTDIAKKLEETSITVTVKVGEGDKLYGSVTTQLIAEKLNAEGFNINKKDVMLEEAIRALGVYNVKIHVHQSVTADVKIWVVKEGQSESEVAPASEPVA